MTQEQLHGLGACLPRFHSTSLVILSGQKRGGSRRRGRLWRKGRARTGRWYALYQMV